MRSSPHGENFEKVTKVERMWSNQIHKYCRRLGAGCRRIWYWTYASLFFKVNCQLDEIRDELDTPKLKEPWFMNSNYPFIKKFEQLWNSRHKCVKWSKVKMSRLNIKYEPVWLKNIRLGTQGIVVSIPACHVWTCPDLANSSRETGVWFPVTESYVL